MSYQVLARKWRPRAFTEMVGQEHVLRALINGLDNDRLHHAYLFTGTRGVGKTTLARILAKCLNCDAGVSSTPCNQCSACTEIAEGRFVDLIEVDAASRTKVEDTRELLDNVQYAPSRGRYKVYLIDEVHMLSTHSFNALLKTLEEPPPHVKFLLATTDPQKLPVTILSRCLQFNLKNLNPERIVGHLKFVLGEEKIPFEESALWELGRSADGSMRDALSLTDQAIAHGGGTLTADEVSVMLGTIDRSSVMEICQAVAEGSAQRAMERVEHMADHAPDYAAALGDMLAIWHQVAIAQTIPDALDPVQEYHHEVLLLASQVSREDIQLFYQMTLLGRKDLPYAADSRSGFEMVLLRLLAFRPVTPGQAQLPSSGGAPVASPAAGEAANPPKKVERVPSASSGGGSVTSVAIDHRVSENSDQQVDADVTAPVAREIAKQPESEIVAEPLADELLADRAPMVQPEQGGKPDKGRETDSTSNVTPIRPEVSVATVEDAVAKPSRSEQSVDAVVGEVTDSESDSELDSLADYESYSASSMAHMEAQTADAGQGEDPSASGTSRSGTPAMAMVAPGERVGLGELNSENWKLVCDGLGQGGLLHNTAINLVLDEVGETALCFTLDQSNSALYDESQQTRLVEVLSEYFSVAVDVTIRVAPIDRESPRMIAERLKAERLQLAIESLKSDPNVIEMISVFGAELVEASVQPID